MNIAVFVSGRGSNLKSILETPGLEHLIKVEAVFSNKPDCQAFQVAGKYSIDTYTIGSGEEFISYPEAEKILSQKKVELVVLAGYLKLIPEDFIKKFENRIINIHPALLPSFGGKGMYGMNVHRAVYESSAKVSGPTVHFVDAKFDTGIIIAQKCVDISDVNSPGEIAGRVLEQEHKILPFVIKKFAERKIEIKDGRAVILQ